MPKHTKDYFTSFYGTLHCAAPEILLNKPYRGPEQDVWCLGVLLYTLAFGQTPFRDANGILSGKWRVPTVRRSEGLMKVLERCLEVEVGKRATVEEVMELDWVRGGKGDVVE